MSSIDDSHTTTAPTQQQWSSDAERGATSYCRCSTVLVNLEDCVCGLCEVKTYVSCLFSGLYFFFCHATANVILHICCCRCFASLLETPDELEPKNNAQKVFLFFMKQLSNFWASSLLFFVAWLVFFRPFAATPTLGASVVYEFELQGQPPGTMVGPSFAPQLRFNLSAHLLLKNSHAFYSIGYNHQAMAVFYAGEKLGPSDDMLPPFKLKPLGWTVLDQVVVGRLRNASGRLADAYRDELSQGQFQMLVKFWVNLTYKFWPFKAEYFYVYECPLLSPVPHAAGEPALSKPASCTRGAV